jgi:hypothetical protein
LSCHSAASEHCLIGCVVGNHTWNSEPDRSNRDDHHEWNGSDHLPLKAMLQLQIHDRLFEVVSSIDDTKNAVEEGGRRQVITEVLTVLVTLRMLLIKSGKGGENQTEATRQLDQICENDTDRPCPRQSMINRFVK